MENSLPIDRNERKVIVKIKAETSEKFGKEPDKRSVEELIDYGIVNINKPKGPTSHQVSAYVQKILEIKKSGHSGTLDPKVTGVLSVALEKATRIVQTLIGQGKEYICIMHLHKEVDEDKLRKTVLEFVGRIKQLPPLKSAVKRRKRFRKIYYLEILEIEGKDVLFKVGCQAGTYIRKLCHDIGEKLGGAHMAQLRRTQAGPFREESSVTLHDLTDAYHYWKKEGKEKFIRYCIKPIEFAVEHLPKIWILDTTVESLCHGANLALPGIAKLESGINIDDTVAILTLKDELVALGVSRMTSKEMAADKGIAVSVHKVFMQPGIYPRIQK